MHILEIQFWPKTIEISPNQENMNYFLQKK